MEGNEIDKLFKSKLSGFEASYNPAGWDAAEGMMGSSGSGRWRLWLLLLLLIVMGSGAMWCWNSTCSATQGAQATAQTDVLTPAHNRFNKTHEPGANHGLAAGDETPDHHLTDVNTFSSSNNSNTTIPPNQSKTQNNSTGNSHESGNRITSTSEGDSDGRTNKDSGKKSGSDDRADNPFNAESGTAGTGSRGIQEPDPKARFTGGGTHQLGTQGASVDPLINKEEVKATYVSEGATEETTKRNPINMDLLAIKMPGAFDLQWDRAEIDEAERNVELYTPTFWQIRIFGGMGSLSRNLSTNNVGLSNYVDQRNSEEQVKYAWEAGVEGVYEPGRFQFTVGANWLKYGEIANYTAPLETTYDTTSYDIFTNIETTYYGIDSVFIQMQDTSYWSVTVVGTSDLDTLVVSYSEINSATSREDWSTYNVKSDFQYIELPVTVGYVHRIGNWRAGLSTGVSASWLISTRGYYLESGQDRLLVRQDIARKWTYHYLLRLHLAYAINDKVNVYVQPVFRMGLNNVLSTDEVDQRYRSYGIRAGVGFSF
ncbi:MAG: hypothetical protein KDC12_12150 [Flavobacteriales bacterium]|nr:hypothetical protein [Flavobacteriales bacterium]